MAVPALPTDSAPLASSRQEVPMAVLFADVAGSTRLYEALGDTWPSV